MNYRHAYHAGNFADVVKHIILARILEYLKQKDKAFRVIDTHAGAGLYDLTGTEAGKTNEWHEGVAKVLAANMPDKVRELIAPWANAVRSVNSGAELTRYPGSPKLTRMLLRKIDRLSAIEKHPEDAKLLERQFVDDYQVRVIELDGWLAMGAHVPPKEKRGLVLVDPPFEEKGEFERLVDGLQKSHARWPGGIYALWYPVKDRKGVRDFHEALKATGIRKILLTELTVRGTPGAQTFDGTGMVIVNPPFTLEGELKLILPELTKAMRQNERAGWWVNWLVGE